MTDDHQEARQILAFVSLHDTQGKDGYLGAILVTNHQGVPFEFRCTLPVKPTGIQRLLYGNTLVPHIGVDLCGLPLINTVSKQNSPSLVIVNTDLLLDIRNASSCAVVLIKRAGEAIDVSPSGETEVIANRRRIDSPTGKFQPIVITTHPEFREDMDYAGQIVAEIIQHLDPLEPFDRMQKAMELLAKQDDRFQ